MDVLIEQQRLLLMSFEERKEVTESGKMILKMSNMSYPPPENPTRYDAEAVMSHGDTHLTERHHLTEAGDWACARREERRSRGKGCVDCGL
jgi:hypothetical protein